MNTLDLVSYGPVIPVIVLGTRGVFRQRCHAEPERCSKKPRMNTDKHGWEGEAPNSNLQAPMKFQTSSSNPAADEASLAVCKDLASRFVGCSMQAEG